MADFNLDRIRFRWKDTWTSSTVYIKDDVVIYNGKAFVCLVGHTASADRYTDAANWELMFDGYEWKGNWSSSTFYSEGDIVKNNGYVYRCIEGHTSTIVAALGLAQDASKWTLVATTYNWTNTWSTSTVYELGDVVRYSGNTYICNTRHTSDSTTALGLEADQSSWTVIFTVDAWKIDWATDTRYIRGDIVKYGAVSYRCIEGHTSSVTIADGLENDQSKWETVVSGIEYKFDWDISTRYKVNDIVRYGQSLWICLEGHTSSILFRTDEDASRWDLWLPGNGYEDLWDSAIEYTKGSIVIYGGYTYVALQNSLNSEPSSDGLIQDTGNWELIDQGYSHKGEWNNTTEYKTGDIIRNNGYLYVAIADSTDVYPDIIANWKIVVPGRSHRKEWQDDVEYFLGDIVLYKGTAYHCILRHESTASDSRPDLDILQDDQNYWEIFIQGATTNVLTDLGDLQVHDGSTKNNLQLGLAGETLKTNGIIPIWENFGSSPKVYYVSLNGTDDNGFGFTENAPFRTVKYACDYILSDEAARAPATVLVKTGVYEEILPISIPANVAVVGDELRSTMITPAAGYEASNMFFVRNGSGLRNMTLQGLSGTLTSNNEYGTQRTTAGAYVSLDPGTGQDDSNVWIISKSPYVQNVTTFGTGCIGMKIDGTLHNSGNKSIVANDFTQVLDDGIGIWANEEGLAELVSVFTYFCHIGYLCTVGGKLRATNGNNSYGTFGSVAEGVNQNETFITASINNRGTHASVSIVHNDGDEITAIGYSHAGQDYSSASFAFTGSGVNAAATATFVDGAVSNVRVLPSDDSTVSIPGGLNYTQVIDSASDGDATSITLSQGDPQTDNTKYEGQRIFILSGKGSGQYGVIDTYNTSTKVATIVKDSDGTAGWDHIGGLTIETELNLTTRYQIEPRVVFDAPVSGTRAFGRAVVVSSRISEIIIYNPGSGYTSPPNITITDNENTEDANLDVFVNDGVLGVPTLTNKGTGWVRSSATITGNGFADVYQTGSKIKINDLSRLPGPGDNFEIGGNNLIYKLVKVENVTGSEPNLSADITVFPTVDLDVSPDHASSVSIRQFYSQVRLTGHDFLDIGTGNKTDTNYPSLYIEGETSANTPQQQNEVLENGGGRVFYTSTDQDGNFRTGELFKVEQSSGIVTVNASQFDLTGLTELSLGGIVVGGSAVVVQEFSKDGTFIANSNNIVPTQAAIIKYLNTRISGGSSNATTNKLTAGQVVIENNNINSNIGTIELENKINFTGGVSGDMLAMQLFRHRSNR